MGATFESVETEFGQLHQSRGKFPYPAGERHHPRWSETIRDIVPYRECQFPDCDLEITEREYLESTRR